MAWWGWVLTVVFIVCVITIAWIGWKWVEDNKKDKENK
jgi:TRAP-type C4-dicarboxylate transport system permease small subunit